MKKQISKSKIVLSTLALLITSFCLLAILTTTAKIGVQKYLAFKDFMSNPVPVHAMAEVNCVPEINERPYEYNERISTETIKTEIIKQAEIHGNDVQFMLDLAKCESTFNNLAENDKSSAEGVYQYLYGTWRQTESGKNHISRFDYKANILEANRDIANEEYFRWEECLN